MRTLNYHHLIVVLLLGTLLLITYYVYLPGINGLFIFDDKPNLSVMGKYDNLGGWDNFWLFLLEGISGPTGRPVSLASFYLDDNTWPSHSAHFTSTNIMIHLLNGLLVFWFTFKLSEIIKLTPLQQGSFSLLATALWILHPMHTTTVLYIVQRMTELSAMFTLAGLLFYLYGRELMSFKVVKGLAVLFLGVGLSLLLSVFSKENGILLVAYIIVIEFFLLQPLKHQPPRYFYHWLIPAVILPFILIVVNLGQRAWHGGGFASRDFTMTERLLTESRVLFDYLSNILMPSIGQSSVFHDDFIISKSILTPWTTLPAVIGIFALLFLVFFFRKKHPLISFAIAWFFAGHLLESTTLALELYFEHRNYLPMLGFFIAIAWYVVQYTTQHKKTTIAISSVTLILFSFLVLQNAKLWGKPKELVINWYQAHPNSIRAQEAYLGFMQPKAAQQDLKKNTLLATDKSPYSAMWNLNQACISRTITPEMLESTLQVLDSNVIHAATSVVLSDFIVSWSAHSCDSLNTAHLESFLLKTLALKNTQHNRLFSYQNHYWLAEIYHQKKDLNKTMINLEKAYRLHPNIPLLKLQATYLSSAGLDKEALEILNDTSLLATNFRSRIALKIKQKELDQFKQIIAKKI